MSDVDSIAAFRRIAAHLTEHKAIDAAWFSAALQEYESSAPLGMTVARAFEFDCAPGQRPWWALEAVRRRDELLREIRKQYFPAVHAGYTAANRPRMRATLI